MVVIRHGVIAGDVAASGTTHDEVVTMITGEAPAAAPAEQASMGV
jgi:hypothetical protein